MFEVLDEAQQPEARLVSFATRGPISMILPNRLSKFIRLWVVIDQPHPKLCGIDCAITSSHMRFSAEFDSWSLVQQVSTFVHLSPHKPRYRFPYCQRTS